MKILKTLIFISALTALGCGQTGPLELPQETVKQQNEKPLNVKPLNDKPQNEKSAKPKIAQ